MSNTDPKFVVFTTKIPIDVRNWLRRLRFKSKDRIRVQEIVTEALRDKRNKMEDSNNG